MKRVPLICIGVVLAICLFAFLGMVFSAQLRLVGVVGLGIIAIPTIAWVLAMRRSLAANRVHTVPQPLSPRLGDEADATALRNHPTWRDDVDGRVGPKW